MLVMTVRYREVLHQTLQFSRQTLPNVQRLFQVLLVIKIEACYDLYIIYFSSYLWICHILSDFTLPIALFTLLDAVLFPICLFVFGWFWQFLHKHSVRVVLTYAQLLSRTVIMSLYRWLSLLLRLQVLPCFYILFNIILIWYRSDLISFSL